MAEPSEHRKYDAKDMAMCSLCYKKRPRWWCSLCRNVICDNCIWEGSRHAKHATILARQDMRSRLLFELENQVECRYDDVLYNSNNLMASVENVQKHINAATANVEAIKRIVVLRAEVMVQLLQVTAKRNLIQAQRDTALKRLQRHFERVAVIRIQRSYRKWKAEQLEHEMLFGRGEKRLVGTELIEHNAAIKIQKHTRRMLVRALMRIARSRISTSMSIDIRRQVINDTFYLFFRNRRTTRARQLFRKFSRDLELAEKRMNAYFVKSVQQLAENVDGELGMARQEMSTANDEHVRIIYSVKDPDNPAARLAKARYKKAQRQADRLAFLKIILSPQLACVSRVRMLQAQRECVVRKFQSLLDISEELENMVTLLRERCASLEVSEPSAILYEKTESREIRSLLKHGNQKDLEALVRCELQWLRATLNPNYYSGAKCKVLDAPIEEEQRPMSSVVPSLDDYLERLWKAVGAFLKHELERSADLCSFEQQLRTVTGDNLHRNHLLRTTIDQLFAIECDKIEAEKKNDTKMQIQLRGLEGEWSQKLLQLFGNIEDLTGPLNEKLGELDKLLVALTNKSSKSALGIVGKLSKELQASMPQIPMKHLKLQIKNDLWTALLPASALETIHSHTRDDKLEKHVQAALHARACLDALDKMHMNIGDERPPTELELHELEAKNEVIGDMVKDVQSIKNAKSHLSSSSGSSKLLNKITNWWGRENKEMTRIEFSILKRQRASANLLEGVATDMQFTVGSEETEYMEELQVRLRHKGEAYLERYPKNLGREYPIYLWFRKTVKKEEFITDIKISHSNEDNDMHQRIDGYLVVEHERMDGIGRNPALELLVQPYEHGAEACVADIRIAYDKAEADECKDMGYQRFVRYLSAVNMTHEMSIWVLWIRSPDTGGNPEDLQRIRDNEQRYNITTLQKRKADIEDILATHGPNEQRQQQLAELEKRIAKAEQEKNVGQQDTLTEAVEYLALSKPDLKRLMVAYARMDTDASASISIEELMRAVNLPVTEFAKIIFQFLDTSRDGSLDFGEFVRSLGVICLLGFDDVARMCYSFMDVDSSGHVFVASVRSLFILMHNIRPEDDPQLKAAMKMCGDLADDKDKLDLDKFLQVQKHYPKVLYPALQFRDAMRVNFLGKKWWNSKLEKFAEARRRIRERAKK